MSGAAMGLQIMSSVYQAALNNLADSANNKALTNAVNKELARQGVYQQMGYSAFQQNMQTAGPASQASAQKKGTQARKNGYAAAGMQPMVSKGAKNQVKSNPDADRRQGILSALLRDAQANLGGWQDADFQAGMGNLRANQGIQVANNFSTHSAALAPAEQAQSQTAGDKFRIWASVIKSLGNGASMMGGS